MTPEVRGRRKATFALGAMVGTFAMLSISNLLLSPEKMAPMVGATGIMAFLAHRAFRGRVWAQRLGIAWMGISLLGLAVVGFEVFDRSPVIGAVVVTTVVLAMSGLYRFWVSSDVSTFLASQREPTKE